MRWVELLRVSRIWRILDRKVRPDSVLTGSVVLQDAMQMRFIEHDQVI